MAKYRNPRFVEFDKETDELLKNFEEEKNLAKEEPKNDEEATFKKRYSDLRRYSQDKEKELSEQIKELRDKLNEVQTAQYKLPKTDKELEEWMNKFPDVSGLVDTLVRKRIDEKTKNTEEKLKGFDNLKEEIKFKDALASLIEAHPDFKKIQADPKFHEWVSDQVDEGRDWIADALYKNNTDWRIAAKAIQFYKDTALNKDNKDTEPVKTKEGASRVTRPQASQEISHNDYDFTESQIQKMNAKDFDKNEEKIMEAMRKGRILQDVTGGAR